MLTAGPDNEKGEQWRKGGPTPAGRPTNAGWLRVHFLTLPPESTHVRAEPLKEAYGVSTIHSAGGDEWFSRSILPTANHAIWVARATFFGPLVWQMLIAQKQKTEYAIKGDRDSARYSWLYPMRNRGLRCKTREIRRLGTPKLVSLINPPQVRACGGRGG